MKYLIILLISTIICSCNIRNDSGKSVEDKEAIPPASVVDTVEGEFTVEDMNELLRNYKMKRDNAKAHINKLRKSLAKLEKTDREQLEARFRELEMQRETIDQRIVDLERYAGEPALTEFVDVSTEIDSIFNVFEIGLEETGRQFPQ